MATKKVLGIQKQLFLISGPLDEDIEGSTSWTFAEYANNGAEACRMAVATATRYGLRFTMELCSYGRGPRIKRGVATYNRIS